MRALQVSEYTDNVDVVRGYSWRTSKGEVIQQELDDVFRLLGGLLVAGDFKARRALRPPTALSPVPRRAPSSRHPRRCHCALGRPEHMPRARVKGGRRRGGVSRCAHWR